MMVAYVGLSCLLLLSEGQACERSTALGRVDQALEEAAQRVSSGSAELARCGPRHPSPNPHQKAVELVGSAFGEVRRAAGASGQKASWTSKQSYAFVCVRNGGGGVGRQSGMALSQVAQQHELQQRLDLGPLILALQARAVQIAQRSQVSLRDAGGLSKPTVFQNEEASRGIWSCKCAGFVSSVHSEARALRKRA